MDQLLHFRVNETVGDHFLVTFVVEHGFHTLQRQIRFTMGTHHQPSLHRLIRDVVVAVDTGNFFHQIFFDLHIETPARRNGCPLVLAFGDVTAQTAQNVAHLRIGNVMANQAVQLATTQGDGRRLRQMRLAGDINDRASFAAANINQQAGRALHRFVLQSWIHAALIAVRSIGMQTMTTRATGNGQRAEEGTLQQHVLGFIVHAGVVATEYPAHRQGFAVIGNHQGVGIQFGFAAVQQDQSFTLFRHTHDDTAFDTIFIERVHRLTQLQQDVVSHVNNGIDGTDTATTQLLFHPQRRWRLNVDTLHYAAQVARTGVNGFNLNRQRVSNGGRHWRDFRRVQFGLVQDRHVAGNTDDAQAVGTVRGDADFDGVVIELQVVAQVGANRGVRWQLNDAGVIVGNTQLGEGAQHAFRRLAAQFRRFNFEIARQHRTHSCHSHFQALTAVCCAADDIEQAFAAHVNFGDTQFVCVRVLTALHNLTDNHAVKGACNRLYAVYFQASHGNLVRERLAVQLGVYPFA